MNWLTEQVFRLPSGLASLDALAEPQNGSTLRRVDYPTLVESLRPVVASIRVSRAARRLRSTFALLEDSAAAEARFAAAEARGPLPSAFTLAIDDDSGSVLYIPDAAETSISCSCLLTAEPESSVFGRTEPSTRRTQYSKS